MKILRDYIGIEPFTVKVDQSAELEELVLRARELKGLNFLEKLSSVKKLAIESMANAYEEMIEGKTSEGRAKGREILMEPHTLSYALEQKSGCCRYQGALFFVLGYEAELGEKQFLQTAPVNRRVNTVFNEVYQDGNKHLVSIFTNSLKNKALDYSKQNPLVFEQVQETYPGHNFYSYHKTPKGLVIIENPLRHVKDI